MSIPTPQIGHFSAEDYRHIYEPAEDSFILLDALEADASLIRSRGPALSVEIGSGSGVVTAFISALLGQTSSAQLATDINRKAADATLRTASVNSAKVDAVQCNLMDPLLHRAQGLVDLMVFNPPYVPTDAEELNSTQEARGIGGAWAGGQFGMEVTDRVLQYAPSLLSPGGLFYLVAIAQNRPEEIIERMKSNLEGSIVLRRRAGLESLMVIRFTKPDRINT